MQHNQAKPLQGFQKETWNSRESGKERIWWIMIKGVITKLTICAIALVLMAGSAFAQAITAPANGASLAAPAVFTLAKGGQSTGWVYIGSGVGKYDYYSQPTDNASSITVPGLPSDNRTIYVQLWTYKSNIWSVVANYTYIGNNTKTYDGAVITSPAIGSTLAKNSNFSWTSVSGATNYWLDIGTGAPGAYNLYSKGQGTSTSCSVGNLPTNNTTVYVRLYTRCGRFMSSKDYSYSTTNISQITNIANGATLAKPAVLTWSDVGADGYWLYLGSTAGAYNYYTVDQGLNLTATIPGLPYDSSTVYVRLWTKRGSNWAFNDYNFTANGTGSTDLAQIKNKTSDNLTTYTTFTWDNATKTGATNYLLFADNVTGGYGILNYNAGLTNSKGLLLTTHRHQDIYVTIWTRLGLFIKGLTYKFHRG